MNFSTKCVSLATLGLLALAGCKDKSADADKNSLSFNDFESLMGWAPNTATLSREQAHSGRYSVKVSPGSDFGLGYSMQLNKLLDHKPHKIRVSGWGYMSDSKAAARLGMQLFDRANEKELFGDGIDYATAVKTPGKWVEISKDITLPPSVTGEQELRVFLYRGSADSPAYLDDVRISEVP